jgi:hypothetical protein
LKTDIVVIMEDMEEIWGDTADGELYLESRFGLSLPRYWVLFVIR